jgi:hypothetical protein
LPSRHTREDVGRDQQLSGSANQTEFRRLRDAADGDVAVVKRKLMDEVDGKAHDKGFSENDGRQLETKVSE